jgi:hypothetical protein
LLDTDLDFALGDSNRHRFTRNDFDLVLDLIVDAKFLEQPRVVWTGSGVLWPIDLALSIARLKASAVLISGTGAPAFTTTPLPARANSTTGPITLPSLMISSKADMKFTSKSPAHRS